MSSFNDLAKTAALVGSMAAALMIGSAAVAKDKPVVVYGDPTNVRTERVSFDGLDLNSARDARRLHLKIASAVKRVCLFDNNRAKIQASDYYPCADGAWENAKAQVDRAIAGAGEFAGSAPTTGSTITVSAFGG